MMDIDTIKIKDLQPDDVDKVLKISVAEGWNQTEKDWMMVLENADNKCIAAMIDDQVVGSANAIIYSKKVAWIGLVLVNKEFRGKGIGKTLFKNILESVSHIESIKLDATPAGQPLYEKFGFREEYKIFRMVNQSVKELKNQWSELEVRRIDSQIRKDILNADLRVFGSDRSYILKTLIRDFPERAFYIGSGEEVNGFILGRAGKTSSYLGPLCASSTKIAKMLIQRVLKQSENQPVVMDVPFNKGDLICWLEAQGFSKQRHFTRMYYKSNIHKGKTENQYFISGPEFG
jgi:predicted GNAT family N-acyltransferase